MGRACIQSFKLSEHVTVYEFHPDSERPYQHWRVYDTRAGYNIVMSAKTKEEALFLAMEYWAEREIALRKEFNELETKAWSFVHSIAPPKEDIDD